MKDRLSATVIGLGAILGFLPFLSILLFGHWFTPQKPATTPLVIAILSARNHFDHRYAIRGTWLKDIHHQLGNKVVTKFILGHPSLCKNSSELTKASSAVTISPSTNFIHQWLCHSTELHIHIDIHIHQNMIITDFGVFDWGQVSTHVTLFEYSNGVSMLHLSYPHNLFMGQHDFRFLSITPLRLEAGFRGYFKLTIAALNMGESICIPWRPHWPKRSNFFILDNQSVSFPRITIRLGDSPFDHIGTSIPPGSDRTDTAFVSFRFTSVQNYKENKPMFPNCKTDQSDENARIASEIKDFDDILVVNLLDTYKNLPYKLVATLKEVHERFPTHLFVKMDDDVYLDVDQFLSLLNDYEVFETKPERLWLGRFRRDWAVMRHGRWAESRYQGNGYPPFACGSLYALSDDLVGLLVKNEGDLTKYQGEDVSMGFWMSAFGAIPVDDVRISCGFEEDETLIVNIPQMEPSDMILRHKNKYAAKELQGKLHGNG